MFFATKFARVELIPKVILLALVYWDKWEQVASSALYTKIPSSGNNLTYFIKAALTLSIEP